MKKNIERGEKLIDLGCTLQSTLKTYSNKIVKDYSSLSYGDINECHTRELTEKNHYDYLILTLPLCSGSDYSGSTVEKANYIDFKELLQDQPVLKEIYGGYSSYGLGLGLSELDTIDPELWEELTEILEGLENYPLINDDTMSNLEMELFEEYVNDEFPRELATATGFEINDELATSLFWDIYRLLEYPEVTYETGCIVYFEWDIVIDQIKESMIKPAIQHEKDNRLYSDQAIDDIELETIYKILLYPEEYQKESHWALINKLEKLIKQNTILA